MTNRESAPPSADTPGSSSPNANPDACAQVIEAFESVQKDQASVREQLRQRLAAQRDAAAELLEAIEQSDLQSLTKQQADHIARVQRELEVAVVVAGEETASLERRIESLQKEKEAAESEVQRRDDSIRKADDKVAQAQASEKKARQQLDDALEFLTEMGLEKADLERAIKDLEGGFAAVKEERAAAEERWNATDDQRLKQIRELRLHVEDLEARLADARQQREALEESGQEEHEALERAWKEATEQREALSKARAEAREKIDVLERQQEEFIAKLVDDYDEQLAAARREIEELRSQGIDQEAWDKSQAERDRALEELEAALAQIVDLQRQAERAQSLQEEVDALRAQGASEDDQEVREELERVRVELAESRAGVDQLLQDCDRLNSENIRLKQGMKPQPSEAPSVPLDLAESSASDAVETAEARTPDDEERSPAESASRGPADPPITKAPEERTPRPPRAGSYSLIGDDLADDTVGGKTPRGSK